MDLSEKFDDLAKEQIFKLAIEILEWEMEKIISACIDYFTLENNVFCFLEFFKDK